MIWLWPIVVGLVCKGTLELNIQNHMAVQALNRQGAAQRSQSPAQQVAVKDWEDEFAAKANANARDWEDEFAAKPAGNTLILMA